MLICKGSENMSTITGKHIRSGYAICHYCLAQTLVPEKCPVCGKHFAMIGLGSQRLEEEHGILTRPGLQCAPEAHRHLGTFPEGTVRLSPGFGTTEQHARTAVDAVRKILSST